MVCFQTKNPNLGKFWRTFQWNELEYFMSIWPILQRLGIVYGILGTFCSVLVRYGINKNLATLLEDTNLYIS
jgi:hypothetical protein